MKSFRSDLNSRGRLPESGMLNRRTIIFSVLRSVFERITSAQIETAARSIYSSRTEGQLYILAVLLCAAGLSMPFLVSAATAPVKLVNHSAELKSQQNNKDQTLHTVVDPFDGNNGKLALPAVRPDFDSIWNGPIVDIAGPTDRPGILDRWPESTRDLADMVQRQTGRTVLSETKLTLSAGDTLAKILAKAKFTKKDVAHVSEALSGHLNLRRLQIGTEFTAGLDEDSRAIALKVSLPAGRQTSSKNNNVFLDHYVLLESPEAAETAWHAIKAVRPIEKIAVHSGNEIDLSLYESARRVNIPLEAFDKFVRVMSFSVDFQRDIQQGDQFELIYEKLVDRLTGDILSSGKLNYAGIILSGKRMSYYRFTHPDGQEGWYDRNGESAARTLMRTPVNGARLSSRYGMRRHPVTGFNAMHRGIDFAVPTGTPILAAGSGSV